MKKDANPEIKIESWKTLELIESRTMDKELWVEYLTELQEITNLTAQMIIVTELQVKEVLTNLKTRQDKIIFRMSYTNMVTIHS